ncbi:MAG: efflux RND transporter periplasmic adaptor subunit [Capsulimonadaceae bacterium]|nr:efflux RND transporter periplasmic adaptor subunit [Capsulimonadaceae bacterium]
MTTPVTTPQDSSASRAEPSAPRRPKAKKAPISRIVLVIVVFLAVGGWIWYNLKGANTSSGPMITGTVTRGDLTESVDATGNVEPQTGAEINIGSQITGTVQSLYADIGSSVKAGQLIAKLWTPDLEANVKQAQANVANAQAKLLQDEEGVNQTHVTDVMGVQQAKSTVAGDQAKLASAQATLRQQLIATPQDIAKAKANLAGAKAALASAQASYDQTKAGAELNVANAQQALRSMRATAHNSALNYQRQQALLQKGFVAQSVVDQAESTAQVDQSNVATAEQNLTLVQQKVNADLETYRDAVTQAEQSQAADQSALAEAEAEKNLIDVDRENVRDAQATVSHDLQALQVSIANMANDPIKQQAIQQDKATLAANTQLVAYSKVQLAKGEIRTPINGTVIALAIQQGETIAAGLSAPTLITVCDLNRLQVDSFPDETDISKIKIGQKAKIQVDALPAHPFIGVVTKIDAGATVQQGVITYDVTLAIKDPQHLLRPSETADCKIRIGQLKNVLLVPSVALNVGTKRTTVSVVKMVNGKPEVSTAIVTTGGTDGVNTEITSGVTEGETIVLAGGPNQLHGPSRGPTNPFGAHGSSASKGS